MPAVGAPGRPPWVARLARLIERDRERLPALLLICLALVLASNEGGFAGAHAYPVAIVAVLLLAWPLATGRRWRPSRSIVVALAAYGGLVAWSALSIAWADVPGQALEATARTALYGLVLAVVVQPPWPIAAIRRTFALIGGGISGLAAITLLRAALADEPTGIFLDGRLVAPVGYVNAAASLWLLGIWPLADLALHGRRRTGRSLAVAAIVVLVGALLLTQSRGGLLTLAITAVAYLAVVRERGPALLLVLGIGLAAIPVSGVVLDVRDAATGADLHARAGAAVAAIVGAAVLAAAAAGLWLRGLEQLPRRWRRALTSRRTGAEAAAVVAVLLATVALATVGDPGAWASERWRDFRDAGYGQVGEHGSRFGSLGSSRYDFYRVALDRFVARPLTGDGADNFAVAYLRDRRGGESPLFAHGLGFGVLAGLGAIGALLWTGILGGLGSAVLAARRRVGPASSAVVVAAVAGFGAWFVHGLADWLWEFPGLALLAFAMAGMAARATADAEPAAASPPVTAVGRAGALQALAAVVLTVALFGSLALASYWQRAATALAHRDPERAIALFGRAARLDPLDADALLRRAVLLRRRGDGAGWERDLRRALARSPDDWFGRVELGMALAARGDRSGALAELDRATVLNPAQPLLHEVREQVRDRRPLHPAEVEARLAAPLEQRLQAVGGAPAAVPR